MGKLKDLQKRLQEERVGNKSSYFKNVDNLKYELGELISEARSYYGYSQEELATLVGTKQPSIARIERGSNYPSFHMLKKIADALDTYLIPPKFGFMITVEDSQVYTNGKSSLTSEATFVNKKNVSPYYSMKINPEIKYLSKQEDSSMTVQNKTY